MHECTWYVDKFNSKTVVRQISYLKMGIIKDSVLVFRLNVSFPKNNIRVNIETKLREVLEEKVDSRFNITFTIP